MRFTSIAIDLARIDNVNTGLCFRYRDDFIRISNYSLIRQSK